MSGLGNSCGKLLACQGDSQCYTKLQAIRAHLTLGNGTKSLPNLSGRHHLRRSKIVWEKDGRKRLRIWKRCAWWQLLFMDHEPLQPEFVPEQHQEPLDLGPGCIWTGKPWFHHYCSATSTWYQKSKVWHYRMTFFINHTITQHTT